MSLLNLIKKTFKSNSKSAVSRNNFAHKDLDYLKIHLEKHAMLTSPSITDEQYKHISSRLDKTSSCLLLRDNYIKKANLDDEIYGTHWALKEAVDAIAAKLIAKDRGLLNRLRTIYYWSGLPITTYRRRETFPLVDPAYSRYKKLCAVIPKALKTTAPALCSEAGWKEDNGLVNTDVTITQERLAYLYFTGIYDKLISRQHPTVLEIGAGGGLFAYGIVNSIPNCRYIICDIPESLIVQFCYLNLALPHKKHYVATPKGLFEINGPDKEDREITMDEIKDGIVYIPNFMMHKYDSQLKPDLAFNAMSLHEMHPKQIEYYTNMLSRELTITSGVFIEINTHKGEHNKTNLPYLTSNFKYKKSFDFYDLALAPTMWTNDEKIFNNISEIFETNLEKYQLESLFQIDVPFQYPKADLNLMKSHIDEELGNYIGYSFEKYMNENEVFFADHLGGYRRRFLNIVE